jgi:hypothetical protein
MVRTARKSAGPGTLNMDLLRRFGGSGRPDYKHGPPSEVVVIGGKRSTMTTAKRSLFQQFRGYHDHQAFVAHCRAAHHYFLSLP